MDRTACQGQGQQDRGWTSILHTRSPFGPARPAAALWQRLRKSISAAGQRPPERRVPAAAPPRAPWSRHGAAGRRAHASGRADSRGRTRSITVSVFKVLPSTRAVSTAAPGRRDAPAADATPPIRHDGLAGGGRNRRMPGRRRRARSVRTARRGRAPGRAPAGRSWLPPRPCPCGRRGSGRPGSAPGSGRCLPASGCVSYASAPYRFGRGDDGRATAAEVRGRATGRGLAGPGPIFGPGGRHAGRHGPRPAWWPVPHPPFPAFCPYQAG